MNFFQAILFGAVEGLIEFLPISSTFHLITLSKLIGLKSTDFIKLFEVFIQSGAILAVVLLFIDQIIKDKKLMKLLIASFIPTAIIGLLFHKIIKNVIFEDFPLMLFASAFVGFVFIIIEKLISSKKIKISKNISYLGFFDAILVGTIQATAIIPGVSRSGATVATMLVLGFARPQAALYSFFLSIPTIIGASVLDVVSYWPLIGQANNLIILITGFIASFITASFSIRWLINYFQKHSLLPFALYRIALSVGLFLFFKP